MRIIALDIGAKKVGVAMSDLQRSVIAPFSVIRSQGRFTGRSIFDDLQINLSKYWSEIDEVVIGDGKDSYFENKIVDLVDQVHRVFRAHTDWKIVLVPETCSTGESREFLKKINYSKRGRDMALDSYSALFLLKDYFDSNNIKVSVSF